MLVKIELKTPKDIYGGMQMNNYEIDELIKLEQMPKIFYQLEQIGADLQTKLTEVKNLPCTEDTKQDVKKIRADINKTLEMFETRRKLIKQQCLNEYNDFEKKYNEEIKIKLQNASDELKEQIDIIENIQLREKANEVYDFIKEHIKANHLENILIVDQVIEIPKLKINLSTSVKSLKEDALNFIEKISNEVKLIELEEQYNDEILLEYQKTRYRMHGKVRYVETPKRLFQANA